MSIVACILHETGHLLAIIAEKKKVESITFYGGGIKIKCNENVDVSFLIITAGSLMNIAIFTVLYFVFPTNYKLQIFAIMNLIIGVFNFLPLKYFDGGKLVEKILIKIFSAEKALNILRKTERVTVVFALAGLIFLLVSNLFNPTLVMALIYVTAAEIIEKIK